MKSIITTKILHRILILGLLISGLALVFPASGLADDPPCITCIDYYSTGTALCNLTFADPYAGTCSYDCYPQEPGVIQPEGTYLTFCGF